MREIKFRAWDRDQSIMLDDVHARPGFLFRDFLNNERFEVEQFTGLLAKSDKEIYEGDICMWVNTEGSVYEKEVSWSKEHLCWNFGVMKYCQLHESGYYQTKMEIIGNIHENLELLK